MKNAFIVTPSNAVRVNSADQQTNKLLKRAITVSLLTGLVGFAPITIAATTAQQSAILSQVVAPLMQKVQQGTITQEDIKAAKAKIAAIAPPDQNAPAAPGQPAVGGAAGGTTAVDPSPLGAIIAFARISCPTSWMEANGQKIPFIASGQLNFDGVMLFIETGGALTTLQDGANISVVLPDLRGDFIRGWNSGASNRPDFGRKIGSFQDQQQANAVGTPKVSGSGASHHMGNGSWSYLLEGISVQSSTFTPQPGVDIRPRNSAFLYCIKVK